MRRNASRAACVELIDCLARAVVGRKVYMDNRMTKPLSEWFTYSDEAFLLLCLESYVPKWNRAWARQEEGQQNLAAVDEDARYTRKTTQFSSSVKQNTFCPPTVFAYTE